MRNRMKVLFSTFVLIAFASQAVLAHPCVAITLSPIGGDSHTVAVMDDHSFMGNVSDHSVPKHDSVCEGDCDAQSALANNPVSLSDFVQISLSKSKNFLPTSTMPLADVPATDHLRGPPQASKPLPTIPTSLFAQHTLLLI